MRLSSMTFFVGGAPTPPPYQVILTGPHLNLRLGGKSREGAAFGGPQVYGDQRGNEVAGFPGKGYPGQFFRGERLFFSLPAGREKKGTGEGGPGANQKQN